MSSNPYAKRSQMTPAARAVRAYAAAGADDLQAERHPVAIHTDR